MPDAYLSEDNDQDIARIIVVPIIGIIKGRFRVFVRGDGNYCLVAQDRITLPKKCGHVEKGECLLFGREQVAMIVMRNPGKEQFHAASEKALRDTLGC